MKNTLVLFTKILIFIFHCLFLKFTYKIEILSRRMNRQIIYVLFSRSYRLRCVLSKENFDMYSSFIMYILFIIYLSKGFSFHKILTSCPDSRFIPHSLIKNVFTGLSFTIPYCIYLAKGKCSIHLVESWIFKFHCSTLRSWYCLTRPFYVLSWSEWSLIIFSSFCAHYLEILFKWFRGI